MVDMRKNYSGIFCNIQKKTSTMNCFYHKVILKQGFHRWCFAANYRNFSKHPTAATITDHELLTHSFPMHRKVLCFQGVEKGCIGNEWVKTSLKIINVIKKFMSYSLYPETSYLFNVNNRNTTQRWEICSKLTIKTLERRHLVSLLITLNIFHTFFSVSSVDSKLLSANPTKWSNTLKTIRRLLPTNCLSVLDHFVGFALKGLSM